VTELYIVRHGIAVAHGTPGIADDERPLTPKGRKRMRQIGHGLRRLGVAPDRILTSPLPRARETAGIVAAALGRSERLETSELLHASRDATEIRDGLQGRTEKGLMIVGHNPGLSELVGLLAAGASVAWHGELKKGGAAALTQRADGSFALEWIAPPRLLRLASEA
jgi:phosphohistidine phosphatase